MKASRGTASQPIPVEFRASRNRTLGRTWFARERKMSKRWSTVLSSSSSATPSRTRPCARPKNSRTAWELQSAASEHSRRSATSICSGSDFDASIRRGRNPRGRRAGPWSAAPQRVFLDSIFHLSTRQTGPPHSLRHHRAPLRSLLPTKELSRYEEEYGRYSPSP